MNDADKKLIDAWHQFIAHPELGSDEICHETYLVDVFAAFDRALADTPTLVETGWIICRVHGMLVLPKGDTSCCCDIGAAGYCDTCDLRPLVYVEPKP